MQNLANKYFSNLIIGLILSGCFGSGVPSLDQASPGSAGTAPTVRLVTTTNANGSFRAGQTIEIQVEFAEAVNVSGTPTIRLNSGGASAVARYVSGSGTSTLTFSYTVSAGEESAKLDYVGTDSLTVEGGSIRSASGTAAALALPAPGDQGSLSATASLVVDAVPPTVSSVTSSLANGLYGIGDLVPIQVSFSEAVTISGSAQLTLETGSSDATVSYVSGSGSRTLVFNYTIAAGHNSSDLEYVSAAALSPNGATITDLAGNSASLTLPSPGAVNSLSAGKALVVRSPNQLYTGSNLPVVILGDVNNDGKSDYAYGDYAASAGGIARGRVLVKSGATGSTLFTVNGTEDIALFGFSLADLGDVNNDGVPDLIAGALWADAGGTNRGQAFVLSGVDGTVIHTISGTTNYQVMGIFVYKAGDVNGDGRADFAVVDSTNTYIYSGADAALIYQKTGQYFATAGDLDGDGKSEFMMLSSSTNQVVIYKGVDGTTLRTLTGGTGYFGGAAASIGDNTGDGRPEIVVGESGAAEGGTGRGKVWVFNGATGAVLYTISGTEDGANFGNLVVGANDIDADGNKDFLVTARNANVGGAARGTVFAYNGASGAVLYRLSSTLDTDYFGSVLAGGGDFNGDQKYDFIIGANSGTTVFTSGY